MKLSRYLYYSTLYITLLWAYQPALAQTISEDFQNIASEGIRLKKFYCDDPTKILKEYNNRIIGRAKTKDFNELQGILNSTIEASNKTLRQSDQAPSRPIYYSVTLNKAIEIATGGIDNGKLNTNDIDSILAHNSKDNIYNRDLLREFLDIQRQQQSLRAERADLYPTLSATGRIRREGREVKRDLVTAGISSRKNTDTFRTPLGASLNLNYSIFDARRTANIKVEKLQLDQNILAWKIKFNSIKLQVANAYYDVQKNREDVKIALDDLFNGACKQLELVTTQTKKDSANKRDKETAYTTLATAIQKLNSEASKWEQSVYNLAQILGLPSQVLVIPPTSVEREKLMLGEKLMLEVEPTDKAKNIGLQDSIKKALDNRSELKIINLQMDVDKALQKRSISALYPTLSFGASVGVNQTFTDTFERLPPVETRESDDFTFDYAVGLSFNWRFFDGGKAKADSNRSKLDIQDNVIELAQEQDSIRQEVVKAQTSLEANFFSICPAGIRVNEAKKAFEKGAQEYRNGTLTFDDLDGRRQKRNQAKQNYVSTVLSFNKAWVSLERSLEGDSLQNQSQLEVKNCLEKP